MWIPIALSRDVPRKATRAVIIEGNELVIWRGESGAAQVWEDRCPHRGMRLSFGFVRGDSLNCLYHGWEYGAGASCQRIPAHPDLAVPPSIKANAYASTETGGMVWVNFDAEPGLPPVFLAGKPIASLAIDAQPETLFQLLGSRPDGPDQIVETNIDGVPVNIGWHVVSDDKLMLHAVALDPGNVESKVLVALHKLRADAEKKGTA
ncbi:MAG: Rieske (2Fe-2S) protein [Hyphomicrobiales bacterium]|nr:MAG: Rieske (2Fe-2S) protein [Hyphomicrobiales bacterium]